MDHVLRDFAQGPHLRVYQHIGLAVMRLPRRQQLANLRQRVVLIQQRPMVVAAHALPDALRRGPEANHQRMGLEAGQVGRVGRQTAPSGNDRLLPPGQLLYNPPLPLAKGRFTVLGEDVVNRLPGASFDDVIRVQESEMQHIRHQPPDGRFAATHESDEGEVVD